MTLGQVLQHPLFWFAFGSLWLGGWWAWHRYLVPPHKKARRTDPFMMSRDVDRAFDPLWGAHTEYGDHHAVWDPAEVSSEDVRWDD